MKLLNKLKFFLTFSCILINACSSSYSKFDVVGQVLDIDSKQPIPNVSINFYRFESGFPMGAWEVFETTKTDIDGNFNAVIMTNDDVEIEAESDISSPFIHLDFKDFQNKKRLKILIFGSINLKIMNGTEYQVTYD